MTTKTSLSESLIKYVAIAATLAIISAVFLYFLGLVVVMMMVIAGLACTALVLWGLWAAGCLVFGEDRLFRWLDRTGIFSWIEKRTARNQDDVIEDAIVLEETPPPGARR